MEGIRVESERLDSKRQNELGKRKLRRKDTVKQEN
jgi:hypothetical protein